MRPWLWARLKAGATPRRAEKPWPARYLFLFRRRRGRRRRFDDGGRFARNAILGADPLHRRDGRFLRHALISIPVTERHELYHADLGRRNQDGRYALRRRFLAFIVQPFGFCNSEMAPLRIARPFFGIAVEAPFPRQVQNDVMAVPHLRECRIPFRRIGCFAGEADSTKKPVQKVRIRQDGCAQPQCDGDEKGKEGFFPCLCCRRFPGRPDYGGKGVFRDRLAHRGEYQRHNHAVERAGPGKRRKRVENRSRDEARQQEYEEPDRFAGRPTHGSCPLQQTRNANRKAMPDRRAPSTHIRRHAAPAPTNLLVIAGLNIYGTNTVCVVPGQRQSVVGTAAPL